MKNYLTVTLAVIMLSNFSHLSAQSHNPNKNKRKNETKITELRKTYLNDKLKLSEAEQMVFWPVYDEYKLLDKTLRDSFRKKYKKNEVIFMDDKKAEEYLNALLKLKDDQQTLYKEYINKLKLILPLRKIALLPVLEQEFKLQILKKAVNLKNDRP